MADTMKDKYQGVENHFGNAFLHSTRDVLKLFTHHKDFMPSHLKQFFHPILKFLQPHSKTFLPLKPKKVSKLKKPQKILQLSAAPKVSEFSLILHGL